MLQNKVGRNPEFPSIVWYADEACFTYLNFLQQHLLILLDDIPLQLCCDMWLLHDGAPSHVTRHIKNYLDITYPVISQVEYDTFCGHLDPGFQCHQLFLRLSEASSLWQLGWNLDWRWIATRIFVAAEVVRNNLNIMILTIIGFIICVRIQDALTFFL